MVAPVVVRPDMDSKNASVKPGIVPESRKGSMLRRAMSSHEIDTMAKASRSWKS